LHYQSLNITQQLQLDNATPQQLDDTYQLLDKHLSQQVNTVCASIKDIYDASIALLMTFGLMMH